jgi:hypothetical protein
MGEISLVELPFGPIRDSNLLENVVQVPLPRLISPTSGFPVGRVTDKTRNRYANEIDADARLGEKRIARKRLFASFFGEGNLPSEKIRNGE